jgi:hypothetical protein
MRCGPWLWINDLLPNTERHKLASSTGLTCLEAFETDLFPLAFDFDYIDVRMRYDIVATTSTDHMLSQLISIVALDKEPRRFLGR